MPFKIDYLDEGVLEWELTTDGAVAKHNPHFTPSLYASTPPGTSDETALLKLDDRVESLPQVTGTRLTMKRPGFRYGEQPVLHIAVTDLEAVEEVAWFVARQGPPGDYRLFNVDFSREFRYCLERNVSALPCRRPTTLSLSIPQRQIAAGELECLTIDGEEYTGSPLELLTTVEEHVQTVDPDMLVVNTGDVVPTLFDTAEGYDQPFCLGRRPGYQRLAGRSTYESYGRVGHSPARYNIPGRVILDESNAFVWHEAGLDGCLDLVERSGKPLQELGWASIGNVLTAIQIREATRRNVLVQWKAWRPERFKTMRQLHAADRGGVTLSPAVGLHADVHELDFASLYPNIICTRNLSPETVRCDCHPDRVDLEDLGYSVCDTEGYLPDVLQPLIDDRAAIKERIAETDDPAERATLEGRSAAIKWILVSCFGYQGFSNAKFGRIEVHEAINAIARDILLDAKTTLETAGWRVLHGIVDSLWVTPRVDEPRPLDAVAAEITEQSGITLEYEAAYDWLMLLPQRSSEAGALTKYVGKRVGVDRADNGAFKYRGIECRQRSTPPFVASVQRDFVRTLDAHLAHLSVEEWPGDAFDIVCQRLRGHLGTLDRGAVSPEQLVIDQRTSKPREAYQQATRAVAVLERADDTGLPVYPGQSVQYVVVDASRTGRERVRLASEVETGEYDVEFYKQLLVRAAESVLTPLGWREREIQSYLATYEDVSLNSF
ncbi:type B DNA-directed DNA polymerase [Halomarina ordinaria]|uniref:DNA-directed DNA polymerase n=1 Tax=Halomarina ordinaria TaxID=3033939 RepID=A0ABD5UGC3_9EURY|nr:type B DNA-directed DNA polymerase [Halomarina sp. PSRA2]